jgi:hypothetical protein
MATGGTARRSPDLRINPRGSDARPGEGESIHVEVPRVQGTTDDGNGMAYGGTRVDRSQSRAEQ